jgi:hypothetical protein
MNNQVLNSLTSGERFALSLRLEEDVDFRFMASLNNMTLAEYATKVTQEYCDEVLKNRKKKEQDEFHRAFRQERVM